MPQIHSYPTVYAIGHAAIRDIFGGPVIVQEKVDGSQFSFGLLDGELVCRSKGKQLLMDAPEKMFTKAVATVRALADKLMPGWTYRGEYLEKPKHNCLAYGRVPEKNIILFDVNTGNEEYLFPGAVSMEAERLGLECVPMLYQGSVTDYAVFQSFLERESILGGCKVEGVVVKNYDLFTAEKKVAMGKYVSEAFKEKNSANWKSENPGTADIVAALTSMYRTEARWRKAVQHLRETGALAGGPRDIGALVKEVPADILKEEEQAIKDFLFKHYWPKISRSVITGLPEWYKSELAKLAFESENKENWDKAEAEMVDERYNR
jgi:hypothetical protein